MEKKKEKVEKVSLLTHATARGMGKKIHVYVGFAPPQPL